MVRGYMLVTGLLLLLLAGSAVYVLLADYDALLNNIVATINKNGIAAKIRNELFTRHRFLQLQWAAKIILLLLPLLGWLLYRYQFMLQQRIAFFVSSLISCLKELIQVFKENTRTQNLSVLLLLLSIIVFFTYHMVTAYLTYDEMWNYNYYTHAPFYYSFFTYSNYPFFEITTHLFKWLPFPMKINLRLSPMLAGVAACLLLYGCIRKYFNNHLAAMGAMASFAFMPVSALYMAMGKGIMHELFFAIAAVASVLFWLKDTRQRRYLVLYFVAAVLGLYSLSTHAILLLSLLALVFFTLINKDRKAVGTFVQLHLAIAVTFFLLYAPMYFTTGAAIFSNIIDAKLAYRHNFMVAGRWLKMLLLSYTGYTFIIVLLLLALLWLFAGWRRCSPEAQRMLLVALLLPLSCFMAFLLTGLPYPARAFVFGALAIPFTIALLLQVPLRRYAIHPRTAAIGFTALLATAIYFDARLFLPANAVDKDVEMMSRYFLHHNVKSCYDKLSGSSLFYYYYPGIEYYYRMQGRSIAFTLSAPNSMRYKPLLATDRYDCIVQDLHAPDSLGQAQYRLAFTDSIGRFAVWLRDDLR
ncbi:MAG TPA: glycosyltransferase family 39 protein [Chitinophagaceae bacterium]|nr:glycosyltransferase family 39 protein [Chitinophagaceae bacterium]